MFCSQFDTNLALIPWTIQACRNKGERGVRDCVAAAPSDFC